MLTTTAIGNYHNDNLLLGFSEINRLKSERPLVFNKGKGIFVYDENGKDYIEAVSCFYCVSLGFSDEELIEAAIKQMRAIPMYPSAIHRTVPPVMELSERLAKISPVKNPRIYFAVTGSEANDSLIKFMWYGNKFAGVPGRKAMINRKSSYHGSTVLTSSLGGNADLHESFAIPMGLSVQVSHPTWPNSALPGETEEQFTDRLAEELEAAILAHGPETIGAMIAEPVSVSTGMHPPPASYFPKVTKVLKKYDIQLFIDEVVTGFGRSGEMWATEAMGLEPDCMTCAKGITSAYMPISGIIMGEEFAQRLDMGSAEKGWFAHAGTHHGHAVSAAVANEVLNIFERRNLLAHIRKASAYFHTSLDKLRDHPLVRDVRKFGLMAALEVSAPDAAGPAVAADLSFAGVAKAIYEAALDKGLIVRPLAGSIIMAPPLIITEAEIDELTGRLKAALDQALANLPKA